jgi:excisionase family DNA binding protein
MQNTSTVPTMMSVTDAAEKLGVSRQTIWKWIKDDDLKNCGWEGRERTIPTSELVRLARTRDLAQQGVTIAQGAAMMVQQYARNEYRAAFEALRAAFRDLEAVVAADPKTPVDQSALKLRRLNKVAAALKDLEQREFLFPVAADLAGKARKLELELKKATNA